MKSNYLFNKKKSWGKFGIVIASGVSTGKITKVCVYTWPMWMRKSGSVQSILTVIAFIKSQ